MARNQLEMEVGDYAFAYSHYTERIQGMILDINPVADTVTIATELGREETVPTSWIMEVDKQ